MINDKSPGHGGIFRWGGRWMRLWFWPLWSMQSARGWLRPSPDCRWWLKPVVERWSVLIQDRLSASQPISLWSPLTGRQLGSCEQPAHGVSLVCFANLLAWESVGLGEEAKHRQVLTSGEKSRCRLMTMMMVRMMHLFPCLYELHRVVWRGVGASFFSFFFPPFLASL